MDIMLRIRDLPIGWVSGYYQRSTLLTADIELRREDRERQTTEHETIPGAVCFTVSWNVWQLNRRDIIAGGQHDPGEDTFTRWAPGMDQDRLNKLRALWKRWHLNTMRAGCAHTSEVIYKQGKYGREVDYNGTPACPVELPVIDLETGQPATNCDGTPRTYHYRYGSAWLTEPLPADFLDQLRAALPAGYDLPALDLVPVK